MSDRTAATAPLGATPPIGVALVSGFYVLGSVVLLASLLLNPVEVGSVIAARHGLPTEVGLAVLPIVAALALAMAYGLYSLRRWGLILTVAYLTYLGAVSLLNGGLSWSASGQPLEPIALGNLTWSVLVIVYLLANRRRFAV